MRPRLALLLPLCLLSPSLLAQDREPQSIDSLRNAAETLVASQAPQGAQVRADAIDGRLRLPACAEPLSTVISNTGGKRQTVAVSCSGPQTWTVYVPVQIVSRAQVLVATRNLSAGSVLGAADLRLESRDTAALAQGYVEDPLIASGQVLARPLAAGAVLSPAALRRAALVKRGDLITLVSRAGSFEVRAQGKALADGATGERLAVENTASHRVVQGQVRADGAVEIPL